MKINLSFIDLVVIFLAISLTIGVAFLSRIKNYKAGFKSLEYLVMGRSLTLPFFVASLVSSWYGGIISVTQIAYEHGIYNFISQGLCWYLSYFIFAFFCVKKIYLNGAISFPELISSYFGEKAGKISAVLLFFKVLPISYSIGLGVALNSVFDISLDAAIILGTVMIIIYTAIGNFRSVVYADVLQFGLMYSAVILVLIFSYIKIGSFEVVRNSLPDYYFKASGKHSYSTLLLWFLVATSTTLLSPVFYQRCMAADSTKTARRGILISIFLWTIFDVSITMGSMYARLSLPGHPENAYVLYAVDILPAGLKGLFISGLFATIISTLDAFTFISGTLISYDILPKRFTDKYYVKTASVIFSGIITLVFALSFKAEVEKIWLMMEGYFSAVLIIPVIWMYFTKIKVGENIFLITAFLALVAMLFQDIILSTKIESFYVGASITFLSYFFHILLQLYRDKIKTT